ncbi:FHA domain-containing protein [Candidatus Sumerlaeota bacterium]|nr:FHA domain-containing protein [Candidatus Sumerlaeota bacterium]
MAPIALICESDHKEYVLEQDVITIGRSRDNDIVIENLNVSRSHARIRVEGGKYILTDLNSSNGTLVNGERVTKTELSEGDVISVGRVEFRFTVPELMEDDTITSSVEILDDATAPKSSAMDSAPEAEAEAEAPEEPEGSGEIPPPPQAKLDYSDIQPAPPVEPGKPFVPVLRISKGKNNWQYQISKAETAIGKAKSNDIVLPDIFASKQHAMIGRTDDQFIIKDLGSWRGTLVNGEPLKEEDGERELLHNDVIQIGSCRLHFVHEPVLDREIPSGAKETLAYDGDDEAELVSMEDATPSEGVVEFREEPDAFIDAESPAEAEAAPEEPEPEAEPAPQAVELPNSEDQFIAVFVENADYVYTTANMLSIPREAAAEVEAAPEEEQKDQPEPEAAQPGKTAPPDGVEVFSHSSNSDLNVLELDSELDVADVVKQIVKESADDEEEEALPEAEAAEAEAELDEAVEEIEAAPPEEEAEEELEAAEDEASSEPEEAAPVEEEADEEPAEEAPAADDADAQKEIKLWERALKNASPAIRKEALKRLKQLTGKDYDK